MDKTLAKALKIMFSLVIVFFGVVLMLYVFSQSCVVDPIITEQMGQQATTSFPKEIQRLLCIQADPVQLIMMIISVVSIFGGMSSLIKNLIG